MTQSELPLAVSPRPFLKWAGGKAKLIEQYQRYLPQTFNTYYEPFLGGGALFFYLAPQLAKAGKRAYLSDLNPELVNVYQCVRSSVDRLIAALAAHRAAHCKDYFYRVRSGHTGLSPVDRAARLIYLNKTCYNGLYRENSRGEFNVPLGQYKHPKIFDPSVLRAASKALQLADIAQQPFEAVLNRACSQDFVYFDPPYHPISETSRFTAYSRFDFKPVDQVRLQQTFTQLAKRQVYGLLSNSDCRFIRELYQDFSVHTIAAARSINSKATRRGKITEVLVTTIPETRADRL